MLSQSQPAAQPYADVDHHQPTVAYLEHLLSDSRTEKEALRNLLMSLGDAELIPFGLKAFRMNMLSLFGEVWNAERVTETARAAAINKLWLGWEYFYHYLPRLPSKPRTLQLENVPINLIDDLMAKGRGLIIVTFHLGNFRYVASDLAIAGVPVWVPLASDSFNDFAAAQARVPDTSLWSCLHAVDVEANWGSLSLARVLSSGGCIFSMIDGNTGRDGPRGDDHRVLADVLGSTVRVKGGLFKLAASYGTPILPLFTPTIDGERKCCVGQVVDPGGPLTGERAERFARDTVRRLYSQFGQSLLSSAAEWSGCDHFHLWRLPASPANQRFDDVERQLVLDLEAGGRVTVNRNRILELSRDSGIVWTDVKTMRCYRFPQGAKRLVDRLSGGSGVDLEWLNRHPNPERSRLWDLMCRLASCDAVESCSECCQ